MLSNVEVSSQIQIKPTAASVDADGMPHPIDDGHFRLVLDEQCSGDSDALEQGVLRTNALALREALARYWEAASKKEP